MHIYWFAVVIGRLPDGVENVIVLSEGLEAESGIGPGCLQYVVLARARCVSEDYAQQQVIQTATPWKPVTCTLLGDRIETMIRSERRAAHLLADNEVSFFDSYIGFHHGSEVARSQAIQIIKRAVQRARWQLWR